MWTLLIFLAVLAVNNVHIVFSLNNQEDGLLPVDSEAASHRLQLRGDCWRRERQPSPLVKVANTLHGFTQFWFSEIDKGKFLSNQANALWHIYDRPIQQFSLRIMWVFNRQTKCTSWRVFWWCSLFFVMKLLSTNAESLLFFGWRNSHGSALVDQIEKLKNTDYRI